MESLERFLAKIFASDSKAGIIGSIDFNVYLAQAFGAPIANLTDRTAPRKRIFKIYSFTISILITFIFTIFEVYDLLLCWSDIKNLTQNVCLSFTHIAGAFKWLNLLHKATEIRAVIDKLRQLIREHVSTDEQRKAFHRDEFINKALLAIYASLVCSSGFLSCVTLLCYPNFLGKIFPYRVKYPIWLPHSIQVLFTGLSVWIFALQIVSIDYLNIVLMNQICCQLNILTLAFQTLDLKHQTKEILTLEEIVEGNARLRKIVQHHVALLQLRDKVEAIFNKPILLQFFTSLIIIAMTGFQAVIDPSGSAGQILIYYYCLCILCELFLYCWCGNEVSEQSKTITINGYATSWYHYDKKFRTALNTLLTKSQEPFFFTAGGFIGLSLPSFAAILKKSYSFIAVLRQMYND